MSAAYTLETSVDRDARWAHGVVTVTRASAPHDRNTLLTEGVFAVIEFLVASTDSAHRGRAVVDIQLPEQLPLDALPGAYAFIEAVRGLIQSHTLETPPESPATNLIVSTAAQSEARQQTLHYLASPNGGFSRGALYDLRSD